MEGQFLVQVWHILGVFAQVLVVSKWVGIGCVFDGHGCYSWANWVSLHIVSSSNLVYMVSQVPKATTEQAAMYKHFHSLCLCQICYLSQDHIHRSGILPLNEREQQRHTEKDMDARRAVICDHLGQPFHYSCIWKSTRDDAYTTPITA